MATQQELKDRLVELNLQKIDAIREVQQARREIRELEK